MSYHVCIRSNIVRRRYDDTSIDMGDGLVGIGMDGTTWHWCCYREGTNGRERDEAPSGALSSVIQSSTLCLLSLSLSLSLVSSACPSFAPTFQFQFQSTPTFTCSFPVATFLSKKSFRSTQPPSYRYKLPHPLTSTFTSALLLLFSSLHLTSSIFTLRISHLTLFPQQKLPFLLQ